MSADEQTVVAAWPWLPGVNGPLANVGVLADVQSTTMLLLVTLVSLLVQVYSLGYLAGEPAPALGRYYAFQSLFAFSMMGVVLAPNLLHLFICWDLVGVCSFLLIGFAPTLYLRAFFEKCPSRRLIHIRGHPAARGWPPTASSPRPWMCWSWILYSR